MTGWPQYESHKIVRAAQIVSISTVDGKRLITVQPEDGGPATWFEPDLANMPANVGDWAMLYPDNYKSICPAKAFAEGYTRK